MKYKIAICDDEKNVCSRLEELIYKFFKDRSERCEVEVWYDSDSLCHQIGIAQSRRSDFKKAILNYKSEEAL